MRTSWTSPSCSLPRGASQRVCHLHFKLLRCAPVAPLTPQWRACRAGGIQLAVLHPRKLAVYSVTAVGGGAVGASYLELKRLYEHYLEHTAANMCYGEFGGAKGEP